ncbi:MAG: RDD family protein [Proteobacteria bacterium]|nr:RDD family protein [Pseudomonadota bacterium]
MVLAPAVSAVAAVPPRYAPFPRRVAAVAVDGVVLAVAVLLIVHGANALAPADGAVFDAFWLAVQPVHVAVETAREERERMAGGVLRETTYRRETRFFADGAVRVYAVIDSRLTGADGAVSTFRTEEPVGQNVRALVRWRLTQALLFVVPFAYFAAMEAARMQATIGKLALGLRVTGLDGGPLPLGRNLIRQLTKTMSLMTAGLCYVIAVFTDRRQALHDILAGTLVLDARA